LHPPGLLCIVIPSAAPGARAAIDARSGSPIVAHEIELTIVRSARTSSALMLDLICAMKTGVGRRR
jgi:hypothetical protein